jgi:RNA polymerase sigma factor (TIGR02999 family)
MSESSSQPITQLLTAAGRGDADAHREVWSLIYDELHRIARSQVEYEAPGRTLQATALVNEAYLRLVGDNRIDWNDRRHFFAVAAKIMRRIRVDDARRRKRLKRGGGRHVVSLDAATDERPELAKVACAINDDPSETLALDDALTRLEEVDPRKAELVMLRFHVGLARDQIAEMLGIAPRTVDKEWHFARAWLHRAIEGNSE